MSLNKNIDNNGFPSSKAQQKDYQKNLDYRYSLEKLRKLLRAPCEVTGM